LILFLIDAVLVFVHLRGVIFILHGKKNTRRNNELPAVKQSQQKSTGGMRNVPGNRGVRHHYL
jgi:hypothetical protein